MSNPEITIARHGKLRWEAASEDAGPYYLCNSFQVFATFGSRAPMTARPGSGAQREAFEVSRAVFYALRELPPEAFGTAAGCRRLVRLATAEARKAWRRWADTLNRIGGAEYSAAFQSEVTARVERAVGEELSHG